MSNSIKLNAYAKINLGLDVIGKMENGYHEVRMVMQTIGLHDKLSINKISRPKIIIRTNLPFLPTGESNIAYKAALIMKENYNIKEGVYINIQKKIPVSAGLAGGSTDAAATLIGLNKLFNLELSLEDLMDIGLKLGADIPYCLMGGTALAEGIGEKLTPLAPFPYCHILIVKPNINVSTSDIYSSLDLDKVKCHPNIDGIMEGIKNQDLYSSIGHFGNTLEEVTVQKHPEINTIKEDMLNKGALVSMMSGSGPTVFGIFDDAKVAEEAFYYFKVSDFRYQVFLTNPKRVVKA